MKIWWCEKEYSGGREGGRKEGEGGREEGGRGREGGRGEGGKGREKQQIPPAVDFPQAQLVIIIIIIMWQSQVENEHYSATSMTCNS